MQQVYGKKKTMISVKKQSSFIEITLSHVFSCKFAAYF